jgi:hypothetical protein
MDRDEASAMDPDDEQAKARKKRADELRSSISGVETGEKSKAAPTPREITDEAARKARKDAEDPRADYKDR